MRDHDVKRMFELSQQVIQRGYDLQECLIGLLEHYRNFLTVITTKSTDLIDAAGGTRERYAAEAERITQQDLIRVMSLISQGEAILRQNPPQPRVRFEFTLVLLASMDTSVELGELLGRLGVEGGKAPVGGVAMAVKVGPMRKVARPTRSVKGARDPVSSLTTKNLAAKWNSVLEELPEHLAFVRSTVKQGMLTIDFTEVGIVLRPLAEVIQHRLNDKLPDLKDHLVKVYGVKLAVQLLDAPDPTDLAEADAGSKGVASETLLPIEKVLVDLFKARRIKSNRH